MRGPAPSSLWHQGASLPLLTALIVLFILESVLPGRSPFIALSYIVVLMGSAWAMSHDRRHLAGSLGLLGIAVLARGWYEMNPGRFTLLLSLGCGILFLTYSAIFIFRRTVAAPGRVGQDRIAGAICVYLMMGVVGASLASGIEIIQPGSFRFPEAVHPGASPLLGPEASAFLYFAFVTLATLGYGDITPVTPPARTFSWMLAVAGQMYVAIVVARLVSLGFSGTAAPPADEEAGRGHP